MMAGANANDPAWAALATDARWLLPQWPAPASVRAVVTTRQGPGQSAPPYDRFNLGMNSGEAIPIVEANRQALGLALGLTEPPLFLRQVHGIEVYQAGWTTSTTPGRRPHHSERSPLGLTPLGKPDAPDRAAATSTFDPLTSGRPGRSGVARVASESAAVPCADAIVSRQPGQLLAILTADCLPVLFCSDDGRTVGAAHAGWRGLAAGVLEATVSRMQTPGEHVLAWLGPCIGAASYEVGDEVRSAFVDFDARAHGAFRATRPGHWMCDLAALARQRLHALGVTAVFGGKFDTLTDRRFYSYRRDGAGSGRFASLIGLR